MDLKGFEFETISKPIPGDGMKCNPDRVEREGPPAEDFCRSSGPKLRQGLSGEKYQNSSNIRGPCYLQGPLF